MSEIVEKYKNAETGLPANNLVWEMYGAGLDNFGKEGKPAVRELPEYGPDELLLRTDAVGICFSDVKLTSLGPEHPRITGRDLITDPVVPGHEVSATVVGVGVNLESRFKIGERYIVQADVFYKGESIAYGYVLPGAMQQYGVVGPEILSGDEGCYLLPVKEDTGYLQAALAEPWACVVAAYRIGYRNGIKKGGKCLVLAVDGFDTDQITVGDGFGPENCPSQIAISNVKGALDATFQDLCKTNDIKHSVHNVLTADEIAEISEELTSGKGFDDIIVLGTPSAELAKALGNALGKDGCLNIVSDTPIDQDVEIDVGRVHYDGLNFVGTSESDITLAYQAVRAELLPGGAAWFIGAAGPMGQMHVQRAVELESPPAKILCTDIDDSRIDMLRLRVEKLAQEKGIEIRFENPTKMAPEELDSIISEFSEGGGFDDIVSLVPVSALIAHSAKHLAHYGVLNIFAGVPRGTKAMLPLSDVFLKEVRYIGSSGSKLSDLEDTLHLSEEGALGTANSAAAIGGMNAMREGIAAVKDGKYPGKTVIFPQFADFPLTAISDLKEQLPSVYAKLKDGLFWTVEAEDEFFRVMLEKNREAGV